MRQGPFGALCTGIVVAPRVVLTAKHCVQPSGADRPLDPGSLLVTGTPVGSAIASDPYVDGGADDSFAVSSVQTTPGAWFDTPTGPVGALRGVDVAVLVIAREIAVMPASVRFDATSLVEADPVRIVAMGRSSDGAAGIRRVLAVHVARVDGATITTDGAACDGDSGGALFDAAGRVRAVLSTSAAPCGAAGIEFVAIDVVRDEITRALEETGATTAPVDAGVDAIGDAEGATPVPGGCSTRGASRIDRSMAIASIAALVAATRRSRRRGRLTPPVRTTGA